MIDMQLPRSRSPNRLLASLPRDEYERLMPDLATMSLHAKHSLFKPNDHPNSVYFLEGGVCSLSTITADGETAGVAILGNEAVIGMRAFGGDPESTESATVEIVKGDAKVMDLTVFRREMERSGVFCDLIHRYAQAFGESLMQSVACNALHSIEQRYARCLLEIRDRIDHNEISLTQDTLADLLGVRRASITVTAQELNRTGITDHGHKHIVIRDHRRLEAVACKCYAVIRQHLANVFH
jgi:CRP-like cAMP-binding protein